MIVPELAAGDSLRREECTRFYGMTKSGDLRNYTWAKNTSWTNRPLIGGALATAGNLLFLGERDGYLDTFDAGSGAKLRKFNLGASTRPRLPIR
jgi:outer membrane protein assembly factor BamB